MSIFFPKGTVFKVFFVDFTIVDNIQHQPLF
jgi:hypothetical protein